MQVRKIVPVCLAACLMGSILGTATAVFSETNALPECGPASPPSDSCRAAKQESGTTACQQCCQQKCANVSNEPVILPTDPPLTVSPRQGCITGCTNASGCGG
jgi:hypothetical protein